MCLGPELLIAAASAAASGIGAMISQDEAAADAASRTTTRNRELQENLVKQKAFERSSREFLSERQEDMKEGNQQQRLQEGQDERSKLLEDALRPAEVSALPLSGSAPNVVKSEVAKRMLSAMQDSRKKAQALGQLGGYDQQWFGNALNNAQLGRDLGTVNSFSRAEAGMLPAMQDLAEVGAAKPPSGVGNIIQGVSSAAGAAAGSKWFS